MHYSTICFKNQTMFAPVKIDCYYRVTTDSILGYIEIKMKKALKRLRIKAFLNGRSDGIRTHGLLVPN